MVDIPQAKLLVRIQTLWNQLLTNWQPLDRLNDWQTFFTTTRNRLSTSLPDSSLEIAAPPQSSSSMTRHLFFKMCQEDLAHHTVTVLSNLQGAAFYFSYVLDKGEFDLPANPQAMLDYLCERYNYSLSQRVLILTLTSNTSGPATNAEMNVWAKWNMPKSRVLQEIKGPLVVSLLVSPICLLFPRTLKSYPKKQDLLQVRMILAYFF